MNQWGLKGLVVLKDVENVNVNSAKSVGKQICLSRKFALLPPGSNDMHKFLDVMHNRDYSRSPLQVARRKRT